MNVVPLMILVSLVLVGGSLLLFAHSMRQKDHLQSDRLALLPLDDTDSESTVGSSNAREPCKP